MEGTVAASRVGPTGRRGTGEPGKVKEPGRLPPELAALAIEPEPMTNGEPERWHAAAHMRNIKHLTPFYIIRIYNHSLILKRIIGCFVTIAIVQCVQTVNAVLQYRCSNQALSRAGHASTWQARPR